MTKAKSESKAADVQPQGTTSAAQGAGQQVGGTRERKPGESEVLGNETTELGRNVGTWPDNGQPQKAGEPGEKSPETDSDPPVDDKPKSNETPVNPQKAGEPGETGAASASTAEDAGAAAGVNIAGDDGQVDQTPDRRARGDQGHGTPTQQKLARVVRQIGELSRLRDQLTAEADEEAKAGEGKQRQSALTAYRESVNRQRANRAELRERFGRAEQAAGGPLPASQKAPVDQRQRQSGQR